ncbi:MAG: ATP synthase delta chain [Burkholderiaceae bacterium]|jgi:F-type H+-transporting ATPase subunit delta|nr:MAG: ATP synthase delta chain [Burkholderiaceae bacterium]
MAEISTIARPYAEALFQATAGGDREAVQAWLDQLAVVAADPQMKRFADSPATTVDQAFELIAGLVQAPSAATRNFLRTVIENGRLVALPEVAAQVRALTNAQRGASEATVYSAYAMDEATLAGVKATLEKRFGRRLNLRVELDPALIGGIRVVVGDEVLDTSVKARLEQMKMALTA